MDHRFVESRSSGAGRIIAVIYGAAPAENETGVNLLGGPGRAFENVRVNFHRVNLENVTDEFQSRWILIEKLDKLITSVKQ